MKRTASSSDVQQLAERLMVSALSKDLGRTLKKATVPIGQSKVSVDGFHLEDNRVILAEAWAHVGKVKAAQRNKVLTDMLKLILIKTALHRSHPTLGVECYLAFADSTAASVVKGHSWAAAAASEFGIRPHIVALSQDIIDTIREAQRRQDIRLPDEC